MKKFLLTLVVLAAVVAGGWQLRGRWHRAEPSLTLYGNVDIRGVDLGFRVAGKLLELRKDEGDVVVPGETLALLEREPYEHELARANAELAVAEAQLEWKTTGYRREEIQQAQAVVEESRVAAADARRVYQRQVGLVGGGGTSRQSLESAQAVLEAAGQRVKVAEAALGLLEAGYRREEIAAAAAQVEAARAARAGAALRLADTELQAPAAGIVLTRAVEPGAIVAAGATVLSLSMEKPVWVRAYVHERELGMVAPGTEVWLTSDSRPERPFRGTVGFVSPRAEFTPKSVETPELRTSLVYRLRIVVADSDGSLRQGMPVTVSLAPTPW